MHPNKHIKDNSKIIINMVQEYFNMKMVIFIWGNGNMIDIMVKGFLLELMEKGIKGK